MALFKQAATCVDCEAEIPEEARFCPQCARPAGDVYRRCPKEGCDGIASMEDEFCKRCGMRLPTVDREVLFDILWEPPRGQIARRFRIDTEKQAVEGVITVRYGHRALLLGDGSHTKELRPGAHPIETTMRDLHVGAEGARRYEIIYFDTSEQTLDYSFANVRSKDGLPCLADVRLVVEIREPERLLANAMKNVETVTHEGLRRRVRREVRNAVEEGIGSWVGDDLLATREKKDELAGIVGTHMRRTMEGLGFSLVRVETLDARSAALDPVLAERTQRGIKHVRKLESVAELQQTAEIHELKAEAWARLRQSVHRAERDQVGDKMAMEDFLRVQNKENAEKELIAQSELDEITAALDYKKEDREKARAFVMLRLEEEQGYELDRLQAKRKLAKLEEAIEEARKAADAARATVSGEVDIEEMRAEAEDRATRRREMLGLEVLERQLDIETKGKDADSRREIDELQVQADIYRRNKQAKAEAAATKLKAAGEAGLGADQIAALLADETPELANALNTAFAGRGAEERAALERRHAGELREILEAARDRDTATIHRLIGKLSGAVSVPVDRGPGPDPSREAKHCHVCGTEWLGHRHTCPNCNPDSAD